MLEQQIGSSKILLLCNGNIDNDPGYATWLLQITDIEGNIALVAPLTGGQYFDIEVQVTIRQQVEAGLHVVYLQVAEESDGEEEPRYFDLPLTIEVDEEWSPVISSSSKNRKRRWLEQVKQSKLIIESITSTTSKLMLSCP